MKRLRRIILFFIITPLFFSGCEKEAPPLPEVSTIEVSDITALTARSGGIIISDAGSTITARGVCWSTNPDPKIIDSKTIDGSGAGSFTSELTDLMPATSYFIRAYVTNNNGTGYGMTLSFTTLDGLGGILTTSEVTEITTVSAKSGGNITNDGGAPITVRGVVWDTLPDPTLNNKIGFTTDGDSIGAFISVLEGLRPSTKYFVRAYATNTITTKYGSSISFTTLGQVPSAITSQATNITNTGATLNGLVNANYLSTVVTFEYGITTEYGNTITASQSPVTGNNNIDVSANITGLIFETTYHFRVKAENELGIVYSNELSFTTHYGKLSDAEGNVYYSVRIGSQEWMAENLAYLPSVSTSSSGSYTAPYYYVYGYEGTNVTEAKATSNYQTYGVLYNWQAAMNACPAGWHLPTDVEWTELQNYLIANGYNYDGTTTGNKIAKSLATSIGWTSSSETGVVGSTDYPGKRNVTGFSALPGGRRNNFSGIFYDAGIYGTWWSASESISSLSWTRGLHYGYADLLRIDGVKDYGFSVRCIKD